MSLTEVISFLEKHGLKGGIILSIILILLALLKSKWFGEILSSTLDSFVEKFMKNKVKEVELSIKPITESDIINHDIFNYIDFWMYSKIPTFQFSTEYRTVVFRKYLTIYLKSYKKNISNLINIKDYQSWDDAKIRKGLLNLINTIVYDYEREMIDLQIPKIIIDKMKSKNNDTITLTIDLIEGICSSRFYDSDKNLLKIYSILNILLSVLENTISNSESICNSINGQLKGLSFREGGKDFTEP